LSRCRLDRLERRRSRPPSRRRPSITPIARWGEPADVGRAVATAATGGLPFSVGQVVYVDGGLSQWSY
jgi:NAD(P)-dependent dehydrogenase (short-subunit alcohol dehydrogenase family)